MTDLILHHYATSPFSEKVRLIFGYKGLAWKSVRVPVMLPKPDVAALTGGYRRTPFLQIGADIYCDTALMCRVIERIAPQPTLYPVAAGGAAHLLAQWADTAFFWGAVPYIMQPAGIAHIMAGTSDEHLKAFAADRAAMTAGMRRANPVNATVHLTTYLGWLEQQLADGRKFLCGDVACIADFSFAHVIWFIRRAPPIATVLAPYPKLAGWYERVGAFGQGRPEPLGSDEAIAIARAAGGTVAVAVDPGQGFEAGEAVTVTPIDYAQDPVAGRLVGLTQDEAAVERIDDRAGRVVVHFPRIGFQVKKDAVQ